MLALERHLVLRNERCEGGAEAVFHGDEIRLHYVE
jgi:hypothetical protein